MSVVPALAGDVAVIADDTPRIAAADNPAVRIRAERAGNLSRFGRCESAARRSSVVVIVVLLAVFVMVIVVMIVVIVVLSTFGTR